MSGTWWHVALAVLAGLVLLWLVLVVAPLLVRPRGGLLRESLRILPDLVRLLTRLARDPDLPRGVRVRLGLLLGYLALPINLVPDFIPVLGYADDAIIVVSCSAQPDRSASNHSATTGPAPTTASSRPCADWPASTGFGIPDPNVSPHREAVEQQEWPGPIGETDGSPRKAKHMGIAGERRLGSRARRLYRSGATSHWLGCELPLRLFIAKPAPTGRRRQLVRVCRLRRRNPASATGQLRGVRDR